MNTPSDSEFQQMAMNELRQRITAIEDRLSPPVIEAVTAPPQVEEPIVTPPASGNVDDFIYQHGHVHDRFGNCIKNRYGPRCGEPVPEEDPATAAHRQLARMSHDLAVTLCRSDLSAFSKAWNDMTQQERNHAYDVAQAILKYAAVNW